MKKKGFTLFEMLSVIIVILVFFFISIPVIIKIINNSKLNSFKISSLSVIDSIDYYIINNKFVSIPSEGLDIKKIDETILKNNDFDDGIIILNKSGKIELNNLKRGKNCAVGTKEDLRVSNKGCGALDLTKPKKADLFLKNSSTNSVSIVAAGLDLESKIIKYEISVDDKKYISNRDKKYNVFIIKINDLKNHKFRVRITNEAGLVLTSKSKIFKKENKEINIFKEINNLENVKEEKNFNCDIKNCTFEFSTDLINWYKYEKNIKVNENKIIYTRVKKNNEIILYNTLNISNIDNVLSGATPKLYKNMIPVIYRNNNWVVANKNIKYYDYQNKVWANSVFVREHAIINDKKSKSRSYYLSSDAIGEVVYEKDIIASFVWIPRYKYKLFNIYGNKENIGRNIEIKFESKNTSISNNEKIENNEWITHSAFYKYKETNGFWVSKYEASINEEDECYFNSSKCDKIYSELFFIKKDKYLNNLSVSNAYTSISNDEHLITNLEWGAIAYLRNSVYGSLKETITGVYNMDDNSEMVMANYNKDSGNDSLDNSGFKKFGKNSWPLKYIDYYNTISIKGRILGDATLETENWYNANHDFLTGEKPFMIRGKNNIFSFESYSGSKKEEVTFRVVLN